MEFDEDNEGFNMFGMTSTELAIVVSGIQLLSEMGTTNPVYEPYRKIAGDMLNLYNRFAEDGKEGDDINERYHNSKKQR